MYVDSVSACVQDIFMLIIKGYSYVFHVFSKSFTVISTGAMNTLIIQHTMLSLSSVINVLVQTFTYSYFGYMKHYLRVEQER